MTLLKSTAFALILMSLLASCSKPDNAFRDQFRWLSGNWSGHLNGAEIVESWKWEKHRFEGTSYTTVGGDTTVREMLYMESFDDVPSYVIRVNGRGPYLFALTHQDSMRFEFRNEEHDFPSVLVYELKSDSVITITLRDAAETEDGQISYDLIRRKR